MKLKFIIKEWLLRISKKAEEKEKMMKATGEKRAIKARQRWSNVRISGKPVQKEKTEGRRKEGEYDGGRLKISMIRQGRFSWNERTESVHQKNTLSSRKHGQNTPCQNSLVCFLISRIKKKYFKHVGQGEKKSPTRWPQPSSQEHLMPEDNGKIQHFEKKKKWWKNYTQPSCSSKKAKEGSSQIWENKGKRHSGPFLKEVTWQWNQPTKEQIKIKNSKRE